MSTPEFAPPITPAPSLVPTLRTQGFAVLAPEFVCALSGAGLAELGALGAHWEQMPPDPYLRDGGHYRRRRHGSFTIDGDRLHAVPHRAHFQPPEYNALHGGMLRWFEPLAEELVQSAAWPRLLIGLSRIFSELKPAQHWSVEAHQFRIDTREGIGRPTPEGAHRDGVDFVALALIARTRIRGGETRVFDADAPSGLRFTLGAPWSLLLLDDERVIHESTPIQPQLGESHAQSDGHRDTLVLTYRRGGFQEPKAAQPERA
jgi:hypothetical protein